MKKLAIIQARMSSSRLPGKVMIHIAGKPILHYMVERVEQAKTIDGIIIATTTDPSDDILEQFCKTQGFLCYRGSSLDVLDRVYQAAAKQQADIIIRLTADCPLIDPGVLDLTVGTFLGELNFLETVPNALETVGSQQSIYPFHFAADRLPPPWKRTLPIGLDVEVCSFDALQRAWEEAHEPYQREHVMPYLYENVSFPAIKPPDKTGWYIQQGTTPRGFRVALLNHSPDYGSMRWTVDTPSDLEFIQEVILRFNGSTEYSWQDILQLLESEPELSRINADVKHKSAFDVDKRNSNG